MAVPGYKWAHLQWPKKLADEVAKAKGDEPLDAWLIGAARMRLAREGRSAPKPKSCREEKGREAASEASERQFEVQTWPGTHDASLPKVPERLPPA